MISEFVIILKSMDGDNSDKLPASCDLSFDEMVGHPDLKISLDYPRTSPARTRNFLPQAYFRRTLQLNSWLSLPLCVLFWSLTRESPSFVFRRLATSSRTSRCVLTAVFALFVTKRSVLAARRACCAFLRRPGSDFLISPCVCRCCFRPS